MLLIINLAVQPYTSVQKQVKHSQVITVPMCRSVAQVALTSMGTKHHKFALDPTLRD